jgi:hypothetical protein
VVSKSPQGICDLCGVDRRALLEAIATEIEAMHTEPQLGMEMPHLVEYKTDEERHAIDVEVMKNAGMQMGLQMAANRIRGIIERLSNEKVS